jgi:hypothetical protein
MYEVLGLILWAVEFLPRGPEDEETQLVGRRHVVFDVLIGSNPFSMANAAA